MRVAMLIFGFRNNNLTNFEMRVTLEGRVNHLKKGEGCMLSHFGVKVDMHCTL